jgi:GDP-L-fucose synthase
MLKGRKIFIAGHNGMVGRSFHRALADNNEIITCDRENLDLIDQGSVSDFIRNTKPDTIILAAAKVGGILANINDPYAFISDNLIMQHNVISCAHKCDIQNLLFLGSSCIYPKAAEQPLKESALLSSSLEPTNEYYAVAKIAGLKMCEALNKQYRRNYISFMPTNLYGPYDNFNATTSHVIPALLQKFMDAVINRDSSVTLWGTGRAQREFMHVDDAVSAILHVASIDNAASIYNIGSGEEISIAQLAAIIAGIVGYSGEILWDSNVPDGVMRKFLDCTALLDTGWDGCQYNLDTGLRRVYEWRKGIMP